MNKKILVAIFIGFAFLGYVSSEHIFNLHERCVPGRQLSCDYLHVKGYKVCDDNGYWSECIALIKKER